MKHFFTLLFAFACASVALSAQDAEYGLASYYADKFAGKPTASGELYDPAKMTAAHKTHPFGTILRVTRLDNGKSVEVRVNDRGPYVAGRVVDVSRAAAEKLDLIKDGMARVKVEVVRLPGETARRVESKARETAPRPEKKAEVEVTTYDEPAKTTPAKPAAPAPKKTASTAQPKPQKPATAAKKEETMRAKEGTLVRQFKQYGLYQVRLEKPAAKGFGVQVASLSSTESVLKQIADLQAKWFDEILLKIEESPTGKPVYKIILGAFETRKEAEAYKESLRKKYKIEGFVVPLSDK
ncbi:MAG: septal ring lytic transglycosylase RlpA family protein [Bacteroidetes bacterium]|nr:MAG: septal ring lytic transglycosylase RlpA family protein [Bacteroidota bacterium]